MSAAPVNAPTLQVPSTPDEWSEVVIDGFEYQDTSPDKIVTRTARRIASKGFELLHIIKDYKQVEKFGWGRSSDAKELREQWEVGFVDTEGNEFTLYVRVHTNFAINKRNPYDKKPPSLKPSVGFIPKDRETRKALGMKDPE
jgi:hypothetical protein